LGRPKDGKLVLRFKTNLRGEQALASDQIDLATTYFRQRKLGDFIHLAAETLAEFPFAGKGPRERLRNMIRQTTQEFEGLSRKANNGLAEYKEFRDLESLDQVRAAVDIMRKDFQVAGSEGPWGKRYVALFEAERKERYAADRKRETDRAVSMLQQAVDYHLATGEPNSAAVFLSFIAWHLPSSEQAAEARAKLKTLEESHPHVLKVLKDLEKED
jgi:hypothetical protein